MELVIGKELKFVNFGHKINSIRDQQSKVKQYNPYLSNENGCLTVSVFLFVVSELPTLAAPVLRSCWELFEAGYTEADGASSGSYQIEPKGPDGTNPGAFWVYCDLGTGQYLFIFFSFFVIVVDIFIVVLW